MPSDWYTVAVNRQVVGFDGEQYYGEHAKRMFGVQGYDQLPLWQYEFEPDGNKGDRIYEYLVENRPDQGYPRCVARRVRIRGCKMGELSVEFIRRSKAQCRSDFYYHQGNRVPKCDHRKFSRCGVVDKPTRGACASRCYKCRTKGARYARQLKDKGYYVPDRCKIDEKKGDSVSITKVFALDKDDPDWAFFEDREELIANDDDQQDSSRRSTVTASPSALTIVIDDA